MNRLQKLQAKRARIANIKLALGVLTLLSLFVWGMINLHNENKGYKHGKYNYHMCVEVYGLNEDCQ